MSESNWEKRGRADVLAGRYKPPSGGIAELWYSKQDWERQDNAKTEYHFGREKQRHEMRKKR